LNELLNSFAGCAPKKENGAVHRIIECAAEEQFPPVCVFPRQAEVIGPKRAAPNNVLRGYIIEEDEVHDYSPKEIVR
jgi:hypothetical protein